MTLNSNPSLIDDEGNLNPTITIRREIPFNKLMILQASNSNPASPVKSII